jgi:hypothetical protein
MPLTHQPSLKLSACALAVLLSLTACSTSKKNPSTPNPFSADGSGNSTNIQINTLRAFGDSYTAEQNTVNFGGGNWARNLAGMVPTSRIENYAYGGATAQNGHDFSLANQITRAGSSYANRDLSIIYMGYNDIGRFGKTQASYSASQADYRNGVNRMVALGAATANNRLFVTQIHDWSRNPAVDPNTSKAVKDWNAFVAAVANNHTNVIAVDLYTVFEKAMSNPAIFGLANATTPNAQRSKTDYLFYDGSHFGNRGQEIIARTYHHYLTRGWNWANALNAGRSASSQLSKDIEAGALSFQGGKSINQSVRMVPLLNPSSPHTALAFDVKTNPAFGDATGRIGFAYGSTAKSTLKSDFAGSHTNTNIQSTNTSLYWMQPSGGFFYTAQVSQNRHQFDQQGHDDILRSSIQNQRSASTLGFESAVRYTFGLGATTITPWVSVSQEQHVLNASTDRSLYTTDVSYRQSKVTDTYSGIGLDFDLGKMPLRGGHSLVIGGGINHQRALQRDALRLQSSEAINGIVSTEVIARDFEPRTQLSLNADLVLKQQYQLGLTYRVEPEQRRTSQALELKAKIPF